MFNAIGDEFEYDGERLIVMNVPKTFWPCQNCMLYGKCCDNYGKPDFPECRAKTRQDKTDVVFFNAAIVLPRDRKPRRR